MILYFKFYANICMPPPYFMSCSLEETDILDKSKNTLLKSWLYNELCG